MNEWCYISTSLYVLSGKKYKAISVTFCEGP
jgi:hypothetical protein